MYPSRGGSVGSLGHDAGYNGGSHQRAIKQEYLTRTHSCDKENHMYIKKEDCDDVNLNCGPSNGTGAGKKRAFVHISQDEAVKPDEDDLEVIPPPPLHDIPLFERLEDIDRQCNQFFRGPTEIDAYRAANAAFANRRLSHSLARKPARRKSSQHPNHAITQRNTQASPFLRLPAELRNRIYELVFSNKVLHLSVRNCHPSDPGALYDEWFNPIRKHSLDPPAYVRLIHTICHLPFDTEDEVYAHSRDPNAEVPFEPNIYATRHKSCYTALKSFKNTFMTEVDGTLLAGPTPPPSPALPVALLGTCRQVHEETALLPYSSCVPAIHEPLTLTLLTKHYLTRPQRAAIPALQIDAYTYAVRHGPEKWRIDRNVARMLTGLKEVYCAVPGTVNAIFPGVPHEPSPIDAFKGVPRRVVVEKNTTGVEIDGRFAAIREDRAREWEVVERQVPKG